MYFPPSQIKTNLYTSGKELSYASNGDEYVGFYFKTSSGRYYSGKNPNNPPNVLLTTAVPLETFELDVEINNPMNAQPDHNQYIAPVAYLKNNKLGLADVPPPRPKPFYPIPTKENYKIGEFQRYFVSRNNDDYIVEVNFDTYSSYAKREPNVDYNLYFAFQLPWVITGLLEKVVTINENTIKRTQINCNISGLTSYFRDRYDEYFKFGDNENLYTSGGEYIIEDTGREYIGFYHIHPGKGPMEGRQHIENKHRNLLPIVLKKRRRRFGDVGNSY